VIDMSGQLPAGRRYRQIHQRVCAPAVHVPANWASAVIFTPDYLPRRSALAAMLQYGLLDSGSRRRMARDMAFLSAADTGGNDAFAGNCAPASSKISGHHNVSAVCVTTLPVAGSMVGVISVSIAPPHPALVMTWCVADRPANNRKCTP
jgi:hypothetical protein